ncbi:MAG: D-aminoacyl-tRNA deacylase [Bacteroidales bacterium]|nr:D-aminoacyl-tRNA deacylase [Bacteroidales bacterium]
MKIVIQRVTEASVSVDGCLTGSIGHGMMVLVGIAEGDTEKEVDRLVAKTASMRIFNDDNGIMNRSVKDVGGDVLAISQFTLLANTRKGNRPSYVMAAHPEVAEPLYERYCQGLSEVLERSVQRGVFGADMKVSLVNDGPVTIIVDTDQL